MSDFFGLIKEIRYVPKSWGYEKIYWNDEKYCIKILGIYKGSYSSFHYHKIKDETFYLLNGKVRLFYGYEEDIEKADEVVLNIGSAFKLPPNLKHRIVGLKNSEILEISTQYFEEDTYRILNSMQEKIF